MSIDITLPNINSNTESGKLEQIRSYLYQLAEQLKWALNSIESGTSGQVIQQGSQSVTKDSTPTSAKATFNSIKALIISSAEIVEAYYDVINERLESLYVAESDFGTYKQQATNSITKNSTSINSLYTNIQKIVSDIELLEHSLIEVNAHIRSGLLYENDEGVPIYGLEIGQVNSVDGVEVFNKYARFTSDRLSFYDKNDIEVAYISDYKLFITNAEITGTLTLGGYRVDTSNGLTFKWIGDTEVT